MSRRVYWFVGAALCLLANTLTETAAARDLFVDSGQRLGNEVTWSVALGDVDVDGDLDGDGDEDLFIAFLALPDEGWDYKPHPNEVWINTTIL